MALFDAFNNLFPGLNKVKFVTPPTSPTPLQQFDAAVQQKTVMPAPKKIVWTGAESGISKVISELISQTAAAPGTHLDRDLVKIGAFAALETVVGTLEGFSPSAAFIIGQLFKSISDVALDPNFRDIAYQANYGTPNRIVDTTTAIQAFFRGTYSKDELIAELRKDGYKEKAADALVAVTKELLNLGELIDLRFRGVITSDAEFTSRAFKIGFEADEALQGLETRRQRISLGESIEMWRRGVTPHGDVDAFDDLRRQGYTDSRIEALKKASYTLPNVFNIQDFNVRRVDDPAIVEKFKLDAFIDEKYFEGAKKLGYSREDAQRIYRFYWEYPPFFQIARLYTNGKIPEADFRDVLGFLRFTPYWVDKLVADLAPQLTDADIKDMYKYQVIQASDIVPELMKLGKPEKLASQLAALWVASVKLAAPIDQTAAQVAQEKIKGDSLGLVKEAYKDGVLTKADAEAELQKVGYTLDIIDLELSIVDYQKGQQAIKDLYTVLEESVVATVITSNDALTQLAEAGANAEQLALYQAKLNKATTHRPVQPTKAELEAWFKKGIISANDLAIGLSGIGISNAWLPFYLEAAGIPPAQITSILP